MDKLVESVEKRVADILLADKLLKNLSFSNVFERDLKNLLEIYFDLQNSSINIKYSRGEMGKVKLCINVESVKPKKIGINS